MMLCLTLSVVTSEEIGLLAVSVERSGFDFLSLRRPLINCKLVVNTFKRSTAERVPSECSQPRYTCDILEYLFKSTPERVLSECSQVRYIGDIFLLLLEMLS